MELSYKGVDQSLTGLTAFLFLVLLFHDGLRGHFRFNPWHTAQKILLTTLCSA